MIELGKLSPNRLDYLHDLVYKIKDIKIKLLSPYDLARKIRFG